VITRVGECKVSGLGDWNSCYYKTKESTRGYCVDVNRISKPGNPLSLILSLLIPFNAVDEGPLECCGDWESYRGGLQCFESRSRKGLFEEVIKIIILIICVC